MTYFIPFLLTLQRVLMAFSKTALKLDLKTTLKMLWFCCLFILLNNK